MIDVAEIGPGGEACWKLVLEASNNGTLFHDLDFLAYHAPGRFHTRHLIFSEGGKPLALLLAAVDGAVLRSPYGASIGGLVLPVRQSAEQTCAVVRRLCEYAATAGLEAIELRAGPAAYMREPDDHVGFPLFAGGFRLVRRHLCHIVPLSGPENFTKPKLRDYRLGVRRGLIFAEAGPECLHAFCGILLANHARHQAIPTHTEVELADLFRRVPGRVRLFLCEWQGEPVAGVLVFVLNARAVYTFYIASSGMARQLSPAAALLVHVTRQMAREGFSYLDLGPSTFDDLHFNSGLAAFKEGFGARGHCRDTSRWELA